jgi:MerR family transcriptional regulator, copper efflux regulator
MKIGELARSAGVTPDTVRFYEREGLLAPPPRTSSGYRDYGPESLDDLGFIRKAQALGLRLAEVREVLAITADGQQPCDHVRAAVMARLEEVDQRMGELRALRATLKEALTRLNPTPPPTPGCRCAAIEAHN